MHMYLYKDIVTLFNDKDINRLCVTKGDVILRSALVMIKTSLAQMDLLMAIVFV